MLLFGVRSPGPGSDIVGDVVEWFVRREDAEAMVEARDRDEPEEAGVLEVVEGRGRDEGSQAHKMTTRRAACNSMLRL